MISRLLAEKVYDFTGKKGLFTEPSTVVVGVSGGADSMALLHVLHTWHIDGLRVIAVHVHHGLRGEEADRDEALVRTYCAECGIEYVCEHVDVRALAQESGIGVEEAGRRIRYDAFERVRRERNADVIATAHNADDVAETVLMHILRGSGVGGLCGIPAKRGSIVRPLLDCTRAEIESYCTANHIPYIVDSTNVDATYTRNRVRHQLLPLLRQLNPSVNEALLRLRASAAEDENFFSALAEKTLADARLTDGSFDRAVFMRQQLPVRVRMWKLLLMQNGCESYTERHIDALNAALLANRGTVYLSSGYSVSVSADRVKCFADHDAANALCIHVDSLPLRFIFGDREHTLQTMSREEIDSLQNVHKKFFKYTLDCDRIQGSLTVRCRQEGDRFHPAGRQVGKTLKSLFQELRVPTYYRDILPLLCDDEGIVLMPGVACDSRVRPDDSTKHFLVWLTDGEPSYTLSYLMDGKPSGCDTTESKE